MQKIIAGLLAALVCACAHAQVFKWVDGNGVTHYDQKPPESLKSKEVQLHDAAPPTGATPAPGSPGWQDKERAFKQRQTQRDTAAAKEEGDRQKKEAQGAKCKSAKASLDSMRNARRVFDTDDKGERQYLDDDQRAARIAQREAEYNQDCN
jgi:hypothetical protein